jgi:hypothetical protein
MDGHAEEEFYMRSMLRIGAALTVSRSASIFSGWSMAQPAAPDNAFYYVANTRPPDAFLALRTHPTSSHGLRLMAMPNGTALQVLQRQSDGWWYVKVSPTGQQGWVLSRQGGRSWIECCITASVASAASEETSDLVGFKTPSSNIYCQYAPRLAADYGPTLRCDMMQISNPLPRRPRDCDLEWGKAFEIAKDSAAGTRVCHGDTVKSDEMPVLNYGTTWQRDGFTCKSEPAGVTCINPLGHGFELSKNSQRIF